MFITKTKGLSCAVQSGQLNSSIRVCERGWITNTHGIDFYYVLNFIDIQKEGVGNEGGNPVKGYKIKEMKP